MTDPATSTQQAAPFTSTTITTVDASTSTGHEPVVRIKLKKPTRGRAVSWTEDTVDNENMNKRKSKICCIYHKPKPFGESSSSESDDDDDGPDPRKHHCHHHHNHEYNADDDHCNHDHRHDHGHIHSDDNEYIHGHNHDQYGHHYQHHDASTATTSNPEVDTEVVCRRILGKVIDEIDWKQNPFKALQDECDGYSSDSSGS